MREDAGPVAADRGQRPIAGDVQRTARKCCNCRTVHEICTARVQQIVSIQSQIYNAVPGNPYYRFLEALAGNMQSLKRHVIGTARLKANSIRFFFRLVKDIFPGVWFGVCSFAFSLLILIRTDVNLAL